MALLYAMLCGWVVVLRKFASRKHDRLKKKYEGADKAFRCVERDCKNDEVAVGRPVAYAAQFKLMKLYEKLEAAKKSWIASKQKLDKRDKMVAKINSLKGRKVPYTFGLLDMAILFKGVDALREANRFDFSFVTNLIESFI
jgi:hypothetical protein